MLQLPHVDKPRRHLVANGCRILAVKLWCYGQPCAATGHCMWAWFGWHAAVTACGLSQFSLCQGVFSFVGFTTLAHNII